MIIAKWLNWLLCPILTIASGCAPWAHSDVPITDKIGDIYRGTKMRWSFRTLVLCGLLFLSSCTGSPTKQDVEAWFSQVHPGDPVLKAEQIISEKSMRVQDFPPLPPHEPFRRLSGEVEDGDHVIAVYMQVDGNGLIVTIQISEGNRGL